MEKFSRLVSEKKLIQPRQMSGAVLLEIKHTIISLYIPWMAFRRDNSSMLVLLRIHDSYPLFFHITSKCFCIIYLAFFVFRDFNHDCLSGANFFKCIVCKLTYDTNLHEKFKDIHVRLT